MLEKKYIGDISEFDEVVNSAEKIVICGTGVVGKLLADYLIENGHGGKIGGIIVARPEEKDSSAYREIEINTAKNFFEDRPEYKRALIIIAVKGLDKTEIISVLDNLQIPACTLCTSSVWHSWSVRHDDVKKTVPFRGLDFAVVGFPKCGTTSLHYALRSIKSVYLPQQKEPQYFEWCSEVKDPMKVLAEKFYPDIYEGQVVGIIDPSLKDKAKQLCQTFGSKLKIVVMVRNPVHAEFSRYRMMNRLGGWKSMEKIYNERGVYCDEMFDAHVDILKNPESSMFNYEYDRYLKDFLKSYPSAQIKIILFEDLIRDPAQQINDFLNFIGTDEHYLSNELQNANSGDFVWATKESYQLAKKRHILRDRAYWHTPTLSKEEEIQLKLEVLRLESEMSEADKIYGLKLTPGQRRRLEDFYRPSVRRLEELLGRDLTQLWFE